MHGMLGRLHAPWLDLARAEAVGDHRDTHVPNVSRRAVRPAVSPRRPLSMNDLPDDVRSDIARGHTATVQTSDGRTVTVGPDALIGPARTFDEKKAARSQAARKRQRSGSSFEDTLETVHELYRLARRAKMERNRPGAVVGRDGEVKMIGGGCDFHGGVILAHRGPGRSPRCSMRR